MSFRILDISNPGYYLSVRRGFLLVSKEREEVLRLDMDELGSLILQGPGLTLSQNIIAELAERGIAITVCNNKHQPVAWFWPAVGNYIQTKRINGQIAMKEPQKKQLWRQIVRCKIAFQKRHLEAHGQDIKRFDELIKEVQSGDKTNREAMAAKLYWQALFKEGFQRGDEQNGINSLLNYGYAIIRAAMARAVMGAGLHPAIALFHHNSQDTMPLVDDLMEPFRPLVDLAVFALNLKSITIENPESKKLLASVTEWDLPAQNGATPLYQVMQQLAISLGQICAGEGNTLALPKPPPVDEWREVFTETT